jgi:very-short-patch-repair endonuclease
MAASEGGKLTAELDRRLRDQIAAWRNELVNLTRRSRLLYFKHTKTGSLEIVEPSAAQIAFEIATRASHWYFTTPDADQPELRDPAVTDDVPADLHSISDGDLDEDSEETAEHSLGPTVSVSGKTRPEMRRSLTTLARTANQTFLDKGIWALYLAVGFIEWIDPADGTPVESPLLLIPVTLDRLSRQTPYRMSRADVDASINPALAVKLATDFGIDLPDIEDVDETDPGALFETVRELITAQPGWWVTERAVLTVFSFYKEVIYRDLLDHEDDLVAHPLIQAVGLGLQAPDRGGLLFDPIPEEHLDEQAPPEQMVNVLDADSSQRRCIAAAKDGRTFVMDGPPGTGKSQTITNIIAETLRDERSVLFVSEKAAALDVVFQRLQRAGLAPFVLQMHSQNATRKAVAQELGRALKERPYAASGAMPEERVAVLRRDRRALNSYARAMNEIRRPLGKSLHDVLGRLSALRDVPAAPPAPLAVEFLSLESSLDVLGSAEALARSWGPAAQGDDFLWRDLVPGLSANAATTARRVAEDARRRLATLQAVSASTTDVLGLPTAADARAAERLSRLVAALDDRPSIPTTALTTPDLEQIASRLARTRDQCRKYLSSKEWLLDRVGLAWTEVQREAVEQWDTARQALHAAAPSFDLDENLTPDGVEAAARFLEASTSTLESVDADVAELVRLLDTGDSDTTLDRARKLAELAALAQAVHRPPKSWLNVTALSAVEQTVSLIEPLMLEWRSYRDELDHLYKQDALSADVAGLCSRYERVHHGLGRLKSQYRRDKKALAALTVAGIADDEAVSKLVQLLRWQECNQRLLDISESASTLLGSYFLAEKTDFDALHAAVTVAKSVIRLTGYPSEAVVSQLSDGAVADNQLPLISDRVSTAATAWQAEAATLLSRAAPNLQQLPIKALIRWCQSVGEALRTIRHSMDSVNGTSAAFPTVEVFELLAAQLKQAWISRDAIEAAKPELERVLGDAWGGPQTDWERVEHSLAWVRLVRDLLGGPLSARTAQRLLSAPIRANELSDALGDWRKAKAALAGFFTGSRWQHLVVELDVSFDDGVELLQALADTTEQIDEWYSYNEAVQSLNEAGLAAVVEHCIENRVDAHVLPRVIERSVLEGWVADLLAADKARLGQLRAADRDALVTEFAELDRELVALSAAEVISACTNRRPESKAGAAGIIARESEKQKRHMPIRLLFQQAGSLVQRLKPCFMMSPLSVSQYLPSDLKFDVVIFDEASQVRPADAANCIYRGAQLIVAGDKKQLPPTNFFQVGAGSEDDEYEEDQLDEFDSILESCKASGCIESMSLRWHYRSSHETLITYSNYRFYDGDLLTLPSAIQDSDELGVKYFKVDGLYRRGSSRDNPIEARAVIDRVLHHRRHHPDLSLGVVAFSGAQEDTIFAELERRAESEPDLQDIMSDDRLHGFFIKNLENVQGDERDIIIFSIGYGPDEAGKFTLNLGPVARQGGWRRLNVAITRAKRLVEVVASIMPEDISTEATSEGVRHLRGYLDFARRGIPALALDLSSSAGDAESPFEEDVLRSIRSWGYDAVPQVGVAGYRIDIGVHHPTKPGEFLLGVECDGAMYHSSKVARDRDRLRQTVLEQLGWQLHRIWGPAWYRERAEQEQRLRLALEDAISSIHTRRSRVTRAPEQAPPELVVEDVDFSSPPSWAIRYRSAPPMTASSPYELHEPGARLEMRRLIRHVVHHEQPVHRDSVLRFVVEAWGRQRAGARIRENFEYAVRELVGTVSDFEPGFLAEPGYELAAVRIPADGQPIRPIKYVPWKELHLAIENLIADCQTIDADELATYIARLFGWQRTGRDIEAAIESAVQGLILAERIGRAESGLLTSLENDL